VRYVVLAVILMVMTVMVVVMMLVMVVVAGVLGGGQLQDETDTVFLCFTNIEIQPKFGDQFRT